MSGLLSLAAVVTVWVAVGLVLVADTADSAAVGLALLGAGFFAASVLPRVRHHETFGC